MHRNREITRIKREEIKRLKDYLTVLQQRLERYLSYGSGPKRFPLVDVLQYALEFASSKPVCTSPVDDIDASSSTSSSIPSQSLPSTTEQQGPPASDLPSSSPASGAALSLRSVIHKPFTQSRIPPDLPMHPAPRHITEEELSVLESCLHRWRTEIENDTRGKKLAECGCSRFRWCCILIGKNHLDFIFKHLYFFPFKKSFLKRFCGRHWSSSPFFFLLVSDHRDQRVSTDYLAD